MNRRKLVIATLAGLIFTGGASAPRPEAPPQPQEIHTFVVSVDLGDLETPAIRPGDLRALRDLRALGIAGEARELRALRLRTLESVQEMRVLRDLPGSLPALGNSLHRPILVSTPLPPGFGETPAAVAPPALDFPGRELAEMAALLLPEAIKVVMEAARRVDVVGIVQWFLS